MPELPEVETVLRTLEKQIKDHKIKNVEVRWSNTIAHPSVSEFTTRLSNQHFRGFDRLGKYLIFRLDEQVLIVHLRMEGKFYLEPIDIPIRKHTHVIFELDNGQSLRYNDTRKFGKMYLYHQDEALKALAKVGLDPWDKGLIPTYLLNKIRNRHIPLKQMLLDQSIIAGIGNIYADEICFACAMSPLKKVDTLTEDDCQQLIDNTKAILARAITAGGTTIRSYTSSLGISGRFQLSLNVHTKKDQLCHRCQSTIIKTKVAGRGTYYCPGCQK